MLATFYHCAGNCAIVITSEPQDAAAFVGDTVQFNCNYEGTFDVPFWYIGGTAYATDGLPRRHSYRNRILTVTDVQLTDSGQTYQCSFINPQSRIATLTVSTRRGRVNADSILVLDAFLSSLTNLNNSFSIGFKLSISCLKLHCIPLRFIVNTLLLDV